jgi:tetratricopeptide (TPR) repeat protein
MPFPTPTIEKLLKKLEKEPNSLIFLQLAEEYRKEGYYEDALNTCREGLRRHPNYWSARVAMGRIYHETGDFEKAREELEKVIKAVPDNLLANKLLGDIYMQQERPEESLKRYQIVQMLTPHDQDVIANIRKLESSLSEKHLSPVLTTSPFPQPSKTEDRGLEEIAGTGTVEMPKPQAIPPVRQEFHPGTPFEASTASHDADTFIESRDFLEKTAPVILFQPNLETEPSGEPPDTVPDVVLPSASESRNKVPIHTNSVDTSELTAIDRAEDAAAADSNHVEDQTQPMDEKEEEEAKEADELTTQTLADLYVQQGMIDKAVKVYQKLLLNDPSNPQILRKLKELAAASSPIRPAVDDRISRAPDRGREGFEDSALSHAKSFDQLADERRRKISTLENWLASIRRERS